MKQAIRLECARGEEFPQPSLLSATAQEFIYFESEALKCKSMK